MGEKFTLKDMQEMKIRSATKKAVMEAEYQKKRDDAMKSYQKELETLSADALKKFEDGLNQLRDETLTQLRADATEIIDGAKQTAVKAEQKDRHGICRVCRKFFLYAAIVFCSAGGFWCASELAHIIVERYC